MAAAKRDLDLIIGRGLISAETIAQELRERLLRILVRSRQGISAGQLLDTAREVLSEFEPLLADALADSQIAAWIAGLKGVAGKLPKLLAEQLLFSDKLQSGIYVPKDFGQVYKPPEFSAVSSLWGEATGAETVRFPALEKAIQAIANRGIVLKEDLENISDKIKANAFQAATDQTRETQEKLRDVLAETLEAGPSLRAYRERLAEQIDTSAIGPGRLENVYRTNLQQAYSDGYRHLADNPIVQELFPYQEYLAIHDGRTRPEHRALETLGIEKTAIYRVDDPFWNLFSSPWDYNCRCGANLLSVEAAARKGLREAAKWLKTGIKPPLKSRLPFIPFRPPAGFGNRTLATAG